MWICLTTTHLRGHVVWSATEGVRRLVEVDLQLAHAKVHDAYVALVVQQEVVQLQVPEKDSKTIIGLGLPVNNALLVEEFEGADDLR